MKNKYLIGAVLASTMASGTALAHDAGKANKGYVGESGKHVVTDAFGNCVRTGAFSKADMTADCGGSAPVEAKAPAPTPAPAPPPAPTYETMTLSAGALFDTNSAAIKPAGKSELDAVASKIGGVARISDIKIVGHTDSVGAESYNQQLSVRRATSVRDYLASKGVDKSLMSISGMGESSPVASNATRDGRAKNRRVEVSIGVTQQK